MAATVPPGWPKDLPPPQTPEFGERVAGWLLDRAPGAWRAHAVLRRHPRALAQLVSDHLQAQLEGLRVSYASARSVLRDAVPPEDLPNVIAAIEAEGAVAAETQRQVALVAEALAGARWRPRL